MLPSARVMLFLWAAAAPVILSAQADTNKLFKVAVLPFENRTGDEAMAGQGGPLADALATSLAKHLLFDHLPEVKPTQPLLKEGKAEAHAFELVSREGDVDLVITGAFTKTDNGAIVTTAFVYSKSLYKMAALAQAAQDAKPSVTDSLAKQIIDQLSEQDAEIKLAATAQRNRILVEKKKSEKPKGRVYQKDLVTYATSAAQFTLASTDELSKPGYIEYRLDDNPYRRYESPLSILREGEHKVAYRAVDQVGNAEAVRVQTIIIDNTAPLVTFAPTLPFYKRNAVLFAPSGIALGLRVRDQHSGIKVTSYNLNEAGFKPYKTPIVLQKSGQYRFTYKAEDNLNNVSRPTQYVIEVDGDAPLVTVTPDANIVEHEGKNYSKRNNIFTVKATDTSSGVKLILVKVSGDSAFRRYERPLLFSKPGDYAIEAKAIDYVGNESPVQKISFTIDSRPPASKLHLRPKK